MRVVGGALLLGLVLLAQGGSAQPPRKQSTPATSRDSPGSLSPEKVAGKTLEQWIKDLSNEDASIRTQAVMALPEFGDRAHKAVPELLKRLNDADVSPRSRAVMVLRVIAVAEKDVPKVVSALAARIQSSNHTRDAQASVRYEAIVTLRRFLGDAQPAIPALIAGTLDTKSWELRYISVQLLWRVGLKGKDGPDPRVTKALLNLLTVEKTYLVRLETIQGLGAMGRPDSPELLAKVVAVLNSCARTQNTQNKPLALWAFAGLVAMQDGPASKKSLEALAKFLKSDTLELKVQAVQAIGHLGERAKNKLPAVLEMLNDQEPVAVQAACSALGWMRDKGDRVVDALLGLLPSKDAATAAAAVTALVNIGANTPPVLKALDDTLKREKLDIRLRYLIEEAVKELKKPPPKKK
jgi:HEAT repeat protein